MCTLSTSQFDRATLNLLLLLFGSASGFALRLTLWFRLTGDASLCVGLRFFFGQFSKVFLRKFDLLAFSSRSLNTLLFAVGCISFTFLHFTSINFLSNAHSLCLAVRNKDQGDTLVSETNFVDDIETTTLKLNNITLLEVADTSLSKGCVLVAGVCVHKFLNLVILLNLLFVDQVSVLN